jgi:P4 family phage/plasmid primase-like protien
MLMSRPLLDEFWNSYCTAVEEKQTFGLAEVPQLFIPILIDIDLKFDKDSARQESGKFYTNELVETIIRAYQHVLKELIIFEEATDPELYLQCLLLEKEPYKTEDGTWKNGFHVHFPHLFVNRIYQETRIIPAVKKLLESEGTDASIIDSKAIGNTWLLYGSVKNEGMYPYTVSRAYDSGTKPIEIFNVLKDCVIYDKDEQTILLTDKNCLYYLPRILSIFPNGRKCFEIKKEQTCLKEYIDYIPKKTYIKTNVSGNYSLVEKLVNLLKPCRAESHDSWMTIGWMLYNVTDGSSKGLDIWVKFSLQTEDHDEDRCIYEWYRMTNRKSFTIGTLKHFAKIDDPAGYKQIISSNNSKRENFSQLGLAELFHEYCQDNFAYHNKAWYFFTDHYWEEDREGLVVRSQLIKTLKDVIQSIKKEYINSLGEDEQEDPRVTERYDEARAKLNTIGFVNSVIEFSKQKFNRPTFTQDLNANRYLVGFKNGVYDLQSHVFRKGEPADMISNHMNIEYKVFTNSDPKVIETKQFFEKILPNENVRRYFMDVMSETFIGYNHRKKSYFWTGEGDNGKSMTQMFFSKLFGSLCVKAPTTLITSKRGSSGSANAEMARLGNGVRLAFLEEPDPSEEIHQGIFKHLTGNDDFYARDLYQSGKDVREIVAMFTLITICNSLPPIRGGGDKATWNRVRVIPFESTFSKNAPASIEQQNATQTFPIDTSLDQKIPQLVEALAWILLEHLKLPRVEEPEEVMKATLEYQQSNDHIENFMKIHVCKTLQKEDSMSRFDLYDVYKEFCRDSCSNKRPLTFIEFVKVMCKRVGDLVGDHWHGYKIISTTTSLIKDIL